MSVLKWAECHVTLANKGAFFFSFFFVPVALESLMSVMSEQLLHTVLHTVGQHVGGFWQRENVVLSGRSGVR